MISALYPELLPAIVSMPVGLCVHMVEGHDGLILTIKAPKEMILAAKMNRGFRVYFVPINVGSITTSSLITTFPDNEDEPLYIFTPLFGDAPTSALFRILSDKHFDVHFFDEKNHELLAYRALNKGAETMRARIVDMRLWPFSHERGREYYEKALLWFGLRTPADDAQALDITFVEPLYPEDIFVQDLRLGELAIDAPNTARYFSLEREGEPGPYQERDIVFLLHRIFPTDQIYLNPHKADDGKELVDVAVLTPDHALLIQAKDSPNTEKSLRRTIERKKATLDGHLRKAVTQLGGALSYLRSHDPVTLTDSAGGSQREVSLKARKIFGLVILKEIIDSEYNALSRPVLELARSSGAACVLMSYLELHEFTHHRRTEQDLFDTLQRTFGLAVERGQFPRNRFGFVPDP